MCKLRQRGRELFAVRKQKNLKEEEGITEGGEEEQGCTERGPCWVYTGGAGGSLEGSVQFSVCMNLCMQLSFFVKSTVCKARAAIYNIPVIMDFEYQNNLSENIQKFQLLHTSPPPLLPPLFCFLHFALLSLPIQKILFASNGILSFKRLLMCLLKINSMTAAFCLIDIRVCKDVA